MSENQRAERIAEARGDLDEAKAHLELVSAKRALEENRWNVVLRLAQQIYDSGHFTIEAGHLLGKAHAQQGNYLAQIETYRDVRKIDPQAVSDAEFVEALAMGLSQVGHRQVEQRLELRMQLVRLAPEHPAAAEDRIRVDLAALAHQHHQGQEWEALLEVTETLLSSPKTVDSGGYRGAMEYGFLHGVALWKTGERTRARAQFDVFINTPRPASLKSKLRSVTRFLANEDEPEQIIDLYEQVLGRASSEMNEQRLDLILTLASALLMSKDPGDKQRGEAYLRYYVDVGVEVLPKHQRDNVYARARQVASSRGLIQLSAKLLKRAVETGSASRYMIKRLFSDLMQRGLHKEAEVLAQKYLEANPSASDHWKVARWAQQAGQWKMTYKYMKQALDALPEQDKWWLEFARVCLKLDKKREAVRAVKTSLTTGATSSWDVQSAADFLIQAGMRDEAIGVVASYQNKHPDDSRVTTYLASLMLADGQRKRAKKLLVELAHDARTTRYHLLDIARFVQREFGDEDAYEFHIAAGERGETQAFVFAASIALKSGDIGRYDRVAAKYLEKSSMRFYDYQRLWDLLRDTNFEERKLALLEKMVAAPGAGNRRVYRALLTTRYFEEGRGEEAFALWERAGQSRSHRPFTQAYRYFKDAETREKIIEQYRAKYPDDGASSWVTFFVAEQYYGLHVERRGTHGSGADASQGPDSESEPDSEIKQARRLYMLTLDGAPQNSRMFLSAARHFERRQMPKLAESALVRYLQERPSDPDSWFQYAKLLLRRGRYKAAQQVLYRYVQASEATGSAAVSAAREFAGHQRNDESEAFFKMALAYHHNNELDDREHRKILTDVGSGLGHLYLTSGRLDDFLELTSDYYAKYLGEHPHLQTHDRDIDLNGLESRGRWSEFIERVDQLPQVLNRPGLLERQAKALWYLGREQEAWKAFGEHLTESGYGSGYQWIQLAQFLEARGGEVLAATAYDRAVRYSGRYRQGGALLERARFLVRRGHYEAAIEDFLEAQTSSRYGGQALNGMIAAFEQVGRKEMALEALSRRGRSLQQQKPTVATKESLDFEDVAADKAVERARKVVASGWSWRDTLAQLSKEGHFEAIATLIEERLKANDFDTAAAHLIVHADDLAAIDRLAPIVEQLSGKRLDAQKRGFNNFMVDYHLQNGQRERALGLLQREGGFSNTGTSVVLQLALGREQELSNTLAYWMPNYLQSSRTRRNLPLAVEFMRMGQHQTFSSLLERFSGLDANFGQAAETYVSDLLERKGAAAVIDSLRRTGEELARRTQKGAHAPRDTFYLGRALVRGAAFLAASGYPNEVKALLDDLPESVRSRHDVNSFIERMAILLSEDLPDDEPAVEAVYTSWRELSGHVRIVMLRGDYDEAEELLVEAFETMVGHQSSGDIQVDARNDKSKLVLQMLLRLYRSTSNYEGVDDVVRLWLDHVGRDNFAAESLIDVLSEQGFYHHAAQVAGEVAQDFPTGTMLQKAILAAASIDDHDTVEALMPAYWRHLGTTGRKLGEYGAQTMVRRVDPKIAQTLLEPHLAAHPMRVSNRVSEIVVALRDEDVVRARARIDDFLDDFEGSEVALESLVGELHRADFSVEVARVIAPRLHADETSVELLRTVAEANASIGRYEDAAGYLDKIIARAPNPELEASELSRAYTFAGHLQLGIDLAERAFSKDSDLSQAYLARGLARLSNLSNQPDAPKRNETSAAKDLERGLEGRQGNANVLSEIATAALRAEQYEVAEIYLTRLVRLPEMSTSSHGHPLRVAIEAMGLAEKERWGVAFLDRTIPELMQGGYLVDSFQWTELIGELLTDAGMVGRADAWFARAITFHRLDSDSDYQLDSLLDARALNLVVNGGDVEKAVELSREAIAISPHPRYDFLVTLALAQHRRGDAEKASEIFRRAIRGGQPFTGSHRSIDAYLQSILDDGSRRLRTEILGIRGITNPLGVYETSRYNSLSRGRHRGLGSGSSGRNPRGSTRGGQSPQIQIFRGSP
jgi:tetratricopeptide (TPR) repeat protein